MRAFNISSEQIAYARKRAAAEGLADRVEFIQDDYRHVQGTCDAFVSVGMLEHVGAADYPTLGRVIDRTLTKNGRGLLHFIGRDQPAPLSPWIRKRIFPGAYAPTLPEVFERVSRAVRVFGARRAQPALALRKDAGALAASDSKTRAGRCRRCSTRRFVRAWRLYLDRFAGVVLDRFAAAVQVLFDAGRHARSAAVDSASRADVGSSVVDSVRCLESRWRSSGRGCGVRLEAALGGPRRHRHGQGDVSARQGMCRVDHAAGGRGPRVRRRRLSREPDLSTHHRVSRGPGRSRRGIGVAYERPVSFGIRRCEFDDYLLKRSGARLRLGMPVSKIRRDGAAWMVNESVRRSDARRRRRPFLPGRPDAGRGQRARTDHCRPGSGVRDRRG